jgi:hypothetical protein
VVYIFRKNKCHNETYHFVQLILIKYFKNKHDLFVIISHTYVTAYKNLTRFKFLISDVAVTVQINKNDEKAYGHEKKHT